MTLAYFYVRDRVDGFLGRHAVVRARELHQLSLRNADIDTLVRRGRLRRVCRGIYLSNQFSESPDQVVAAASLRVSKGIVCLDSAAHLHGLLYERPLQVSLALPAKAWPPNVPELPLRFWWTPAAAGALPVEEREVAGVPVRVYSQVATGAHLVARRDLVGEELVERALRALLLDDPSSRAVLLEYATRCRATGAMKRFLARLD